MIELYSGTPGSGKSLRSAYTIIDCLNRGNDVISNFPIDMSYFSRRAERHKKLGNFYFVPNSELLPDDFRRFSVARGYIGREHSALLVIDECGSLFNTRLWNVVGRMDWIEFLQNHRKYGYDILLVSQSDLMIDKQIRPFIEREWKCRAIKNYKFFGALLSVLFGGVFIAIEYWYGPKLKCSSEFFFLNKRKANIYNSYKVFDSNIDAESENISSPYDDCLIEPPVKSKRRPALRTAKSKARYKRARAF